LELENAVGYVLLSNYIYAELLAIGKCKMYNGREGKEVRRNSKVPPGLE